MAETSEDVNKIFGLWVRSKRREKDLTQQDLARLVGIDRQQIYRIEKGQSGTRRDTILALAKAFDVSADVALDKAGYVTGEEPNKPQNLSELLDRLESMGITNLHFADEDKMRFATLDELQKVMDAVKFAVQLTVQQHAPTNAHLRPDERSTLP